MTSKFALASVSPAKNSPSPDVSVAIHRLQSAFEDQCELVERCARDVMDDDITRNLARFLVVRSCGFLEQVAEDRCIAYLTAKSHPRVVAFGTSWFGTGRNPTPGNLVKLVGRFDPSWGQSLQDLFDKDDELLKREIAFLVDRRNKIAHGRNEGIATRKALDLAASATEVAGWFIDYVDPES